MDHYALLQYDPDVAQTIMTMDEEKLREFALALTFAVSQGDLPDATSVIDEHCRS